jgi:hypothetical protein
MKKITVTMALIATMMIGCGGESGGSTSSNNGTSGGGEQTNQSANTTFKYPGLFGTYANGKELFFQAVRDNSTLILIGNYFPDTHLITVFNGPAVGFGVGTIALLDSVDNTTNFRRPGCEKGNLTVFSNVFSNNITSGEFLMDNFSGVVVKSRFDSDECPSAGYIDGYMKFSMTNNPSSIDVKYGDADIDPYPLQFADDYVHDSVGEFWGSGTTIFPNHDSFIFKTKPNQPLEVTQKEGSKITFHRKITEADISHIDDGEKITVNASYNREWLEDGETFMLSTKMDKLVYDKNAIISGTIKYQLRVKGKPSRYVNATVSYNTGSISVTYNKEGVESHRNY